MIGCRCNLDLGSFCASIHDFPWACCKPYKALQPCWVNEFSGERFWWAFWYAELWKMKHETFKCNRTGNSPDAVQKLFFISSLKPATATRRKAPFMPANCRWQKRRSRTYRNYMELYNMLSIVFVGSSRKCSGISTGPSAQDCEYVPASNSKICL